MMTKSKQKIDAGRDSVERGLLAERITAWLYDFPGVTVQHDVQLRTIDGEATRQIDVLVSVGPNEESAERWAIECKSYVGRVKIGLIGEFADKLADVGIPTDHGIFVAVNGYEQGAERRAKALGIQLLKLTGLSKDRLRAIVLKALQSDVYLFCDSQRFGLINGGESPIEPIHQAMVFHDADGAAVASVPDFAYQCWLSGRIPPTIGPFALPVKLPDGWNILVNGERKPVSYITLEGMVAGYVVTHEGLAQHHELHDEVAGRLDRFRTHVSFSVGPGTYVLQPLLSEDEAHQHVDSDAAIHVSRRIPLPRIRWWNMSYYPPSERVENIIMERMSSFENGKIPDPRPFDFTELEGTDVRRAWEPASPRYSHSSGAEQALDALDRES